MSGRRRNQKSLVPRAGRNAAEPDSSLKLLGGSNSQAFNSVLANSVLGCLWRPEWLSEDAREDRHSAAIAALAAFEPADEIEGMIAAQALAMRYAAIECFRRAMIPEQSDDVAARLRKDGANMARGMTEMVAALARKRGIAGNQVVRVEHVTVQAGGQAIVGAVAPSARGEG